MESVPEPEYWLRGPVAGIPDLLQPVAHALLQAQSELHGIICNFPEDKLWTKVEGMASVGFHLQHLTGVLDRLFTYARGQKLSSEQLETHQKEGAGQKELRSSSDLIRAFDRQIEISFLQLRKADPHGLTNETRVGRKEYPSTLIGLYVHAAEHTMRHIGQLMVTVKMLKGKY